MLEGSLAVVVAVAPEAVAVEMVVVEVVGVEPVSVAGRIVPPS